MHGRPARVLVDDDQPQPLAAFQPAGVGGDFGHRAAGRIVDVQRGLANHAGFFEPLLHVGLRKRAVTHVVAVHFRLGTEQPIAEFQLGHLQADE